ncbi:hypothetical protein [Corallococcus aberystwythensis]|uniref:Uncharacterized protein n=1 Tax=Corallococcus aberystwythensis TaxID=2316722 RepID=A0A3A8PCM5_9BACT|nr:hypothetical protein [Corallococcus aberystwythensis]RKH54157.1 hypothetical protein D7W81_38540 [Corallococcus aberystwythensis]
MSERRPEDDTLEAAGVERLRTALRDDDAPGEPVDAERVWLAVTQALPAEERRAVIEKVAADPAWAQAWRLAKAMSQAAAEAQKASTVAEAEAPAKVVPLAARREPARRVWQGRPAWAAMAATLVVLVGTVVVLRQQQAGEDPERIRGGATEAIASGVPEATALPREQFVLRWSGVPQAVSWSVQVSSEDLKLFHRAERLEAREYTVPADVLGALPAGARILWQVEARLPDGSLQRSSTFVNRLR